MATTCYTQTCNHGYQLTRDVRKFIQDSIVPALDRIAAKNPATHPRDYRVIAYPFT